MLYNIPSHRHCIMSIEREMGIDSVSLALITLALRLLKQQTLLAISALIWKALVAGMSFFSNCKVNIRCQHFLLNQQDRLTRSKALLQKKSKRIVQQLKCIHISLKIEILEIFDLIFLTMKH